jgi:acetylornithine deacetylase/succinyl-diaminopimelate desuccinylase-like protein
MDPRLARIISLDDGELLREVHGELSDLYPSVETGEGWIYAPGPHPVCLSAHVDTVRTGGVELEIEGRRVTNRLGILGADDRAGVHLLLTLAEGCAQDGTPLPSVVVTDLEETGQRGARAFVAAGHPPPGAVRLFIGLDRRGRGEYVFYSPTLPPEVAAFIEGFGFRRERGTLSDIRVFTAATGIPSVNVSVGYHRAHTASEFLDLDDLDDTLGRLSILLRSSVP